MTFAVQDRTGTVAQLTLLDHPSLEIQVGDTGVYAGVQPWNGTTVSYKFTVGQVLDQSNFGITTALPFGTGPGAVLQSGWPPTGVITWVTGLNADATSEVVEMEPANAYITPAFLASYALSRGTFAYPDSPLEAVEQAIVQATDYLDQRFRFRGVKLLQFLSSNGLDPMIMYIDPWLSPFGFTMTAYFTPSTTQQATEWPRQGAVDNNGDTVFGVPSIVKKACAELALRALNGIVLQPDYDNAVNGAIVSSITEDIGPIRTTTVYDTKFGTGFFPEFPHVVRMLSRGGVLLAGGGRTIMRA